MARNYHEPDQFRYSLGAFIQAGRSVTFMLQKEQHLFVDFSWYESWVEMATKDSGLSWLASVRPNIVHVEALIAGSTLELGASEILAMLTARVMILRASVSAHFNARITIFTQRYPR